MSLQESPRPVLVFARDSWVRDTIERIFQRAGMPTVASGKSGEILACLESQAAPPPALAVVVTDCHGWESRVLVGRIRDATPDLPLLEAGNGGEDTLCDGHLAMPFGPAELLASANSLLAQR